MDERGSADSRFAMQTRLNNYSIMTNVINMII